MVPAFSGGLPAKWQRALQAVFLVLVQEVTLMSLSYLRQSAVKAVPRRWSTRVLTQCVGGDQSSLHVGLSCQNWWLNLTYV